MALILDGTTGISATGNITGGNVIASGSLVVGSFTPASVSTAGNVIGGNLLTGGLISATGNITGSFIIGNGSQLTGLPAGYSDANTASFLAAFGSNTISTTGTVTAGNISGGNLILSGAIEDSAQLDIRTTASNANIVLTPNGVGNVNISSNVMPTVNATANIGSATLSFNTIFARATSAQYADLAEMYSADAKYAPGTLVEFGGTNEVTNTTSSHSTRVAGIISTNPSYLMNSALDGENSVAVALTGRVPCQVVGTIRKGDRLVSSGLFPGVATTLNMEQYQPGCIVAKALEDYQSTEVGTIEVAVGRT